MISLIGNRPALQIGRYQVIDYDTAWLDDALSRAARAADHEDFPFVEDIRSGVVRYLETKCDLKLLQLEDLFDRMRKMLVKIGCERIAEKLEPLAPPVTVSLVRAAMEAGNGFELAFFETLRVELGDLRAAGAEVIRFTGLRESSLILRGSAKWNKRCDSLYSEIEAFLKAWDREPSGDNCQMAPAVEVEH
ncbi:MAG: hypothetical protein WEB53_07705 [Akkermansiaceae bacterium]